MRYYDDLWNQNQDVMVNELGNDTVKQGSDEWYALLKKGDDILERKNAYNKGMMGLLDGQKAVTAKVYSALLLKRLRSKDKKIKTPYEVFFFLTMISNSSVSKLTGSIKSSG